jgi:hypothetical protein
MTPTIRAALISALPKTYSILQWLWFGLIAMGEPSIVVRALTLSLVSLLLAMDLAKGEGRKPRLLPRKVGK